MEENIRLLKTVLKQWKIIMASTVLMAVLMVALTMDMSRVYISNATLYAGIATNDGIVGNSGVMSMQMQYTTYDNLANIMRSRETLKEVGLRLLALHLGMTEADEKILSPETFTVVRNMIPPDIYQYVGETDSITYLNLNAIADTHNFLINLINSPYMPYYSIPALSNILITRIGMSDLIQLGYQSNDRGLCQKTLEIAIDVSVQNYRKLRAGQIGKKVEYFEEALQSAQAKLKRAEAKEEDFKKLYGIVDLATQSGLAIADRQDLDKQISDEQQKMTAAQASMRQIESRMGTQGKSMNRSNILAKQEQLARLQGQLTNAEMRGASSGQIASLRTQLERVKTDLSNDLAESMASAGTTSDAAATEYFTRLLAYEESKARLRALQTQKSATNQEFNKHLPLQDSLRRLQREIEICEKEYLAALAERNRSRREQQDQLSFSNIQVYDKPTFPMTGTNKRKMMVILGTMIGFVIPSSIFLGRAYFNNAIQTPQRAEEIIGLRCAGVMPHIDKLKNHKFPETITNGLSDTILKSLYLINSKSGQMRILIISTRSGEGKTIISNMLCERLLSKGRKCLVVKPYIEAGDWSVVSYKVDKSFYQSRAEDMVPIEKLNDADILFIELPSLIMNDYPVELIRQFDMAFLVCKANREWLKADQTALDSFVKISGINPHIILNEAHMDIVEEILGKVS